MSESVELQIAGHLVTISSPDKVFFTTRGDTKLDLVEYYLSVGDAVMRQMHDRPVLLQRFPNGAHGSNFFQKRIPDGAPDWLHTTTVLTPNGTPSRALVIADLAHLVWAVNLGCLGFHVWPYPRGRSRARRRTAHRPRPDAGDDVQRRSRRCASQQGAARRTRHPFLREDHG